VCPTSGTYCSRNLHLWLINTYDSWQEQVPGASGSRCLSTQVHAGAVPPPLPHPSWPADRKQVSPVFLSLQESSPLSRPQTAYSSETNHSNNNKNHSGSWWWTGRPGVLWFMGSQRVGHDWATDLIWSDLIDAFDKEYLAEFSQEACRKDICPKKANTQRYDIHRGKGGRTWT